MGQWNTGHWNTGHWKTGVKVLAIVVLTGNLLCGQSSRNALPVLDRCHWLRLEIIFGRLHAIDCGNQKTSFFRAQDASRGVLETVRTSVNDDRLSVWFHRVDPDYDLRCQILQGHQFRVVREYRDADPEMRVEYHQPAVGDCHLTIVSGTQSEQISAPTLWHLLLADPVTCRSYLIPIFDQLHSSWDLFAKARRLESLLIQVGGQKGPRQQLRRWVNQLDAPEFVTRRAAERELREAGFVTLSYRDLLGSQTLSAEQRVRLARIQRSLRPETGDTPQRVAAWLRYDKFIWLALLDHHTLRVRQLALGQLRAISPGDVAFDPQATAPERQRQLARLQSEWSPR